MKKIIEQIRKKVFEIYDHLHKHPEISWEEVETTKFIKQLLQERNCRVQTFEDSTGLVAEIGRGLPVVAIRADIDALWQEVDGKFTANHSCGHDAHMAIVLGVFYVLNSMKVLPSGTIRFIFQPAEEKGNGSLKMIKEKIADDIDYLYGVHLRPIEELRDGVASPAILHGAACFFKGKIVGEDVHGARPHLGANAIEVGASLVHLLNGIHINPLVPHSVKMTSFKAGGINANIIPGSATFSLDVRSQTNTVMEQLVEAVHKAVSAVQTNYGVEIKLIEGAKAAAAEVDEQAQLFMAKAISLVLGEDKLKPALVTTGGDDFHFYTIKRPHIKATMLGLGCDLKPGLHHPKMTFNKEAIISGIEILATAVLYTLEKGKSQHVVSPPS